MTGNSPEDRGGKSGSWRVGELSPRQELVGWLFKSNLLSSDYYPIGSDRERGADRERKREREMY